MPADITGRAKHLYSIYDKMAKRGREFNEIYDLTALRVICERSGEEGTRDCYAALGLVHSLWKPMPGRFKDFIAMPKLNRYRSLHTTVIGPEGRPLEIQVRTREMHEEAEYGVAAHWVYKRRSKAKADDDEWLTWVRSLMEGQQEDQDPGEYMRSLRTDLFAEEVYVFTPKGEVKVLPSGATPIDFAYAVHTDVGHRTVGAKVNGRIVPLHYRLRSGDFVEILTSKSGPWPIARLARARHLVASAKQDPPVVPARDTWRDGGEGARSARPGAEGPEAAVPQAAGVERARPGDPRDRLQEGRGLLRRARGGEALTVADRQQGHSAAQDRRGRLRARPDDEGAASQGGIERSRRHPRHRRGGRARPAREVLHAGSGRHHRRVHLDGARHHGAPRRTVPTSARSSATRSASRTSSGREALRPASSSRSRSTRGIASRLLEDVARTFAEHGANIVSYGGTVEDGMARNWYTAEVGDVKELRSLLTALRNLEAVFDAYRVTPS